MVAMESTNGNGGGCVPIRPLIGDEGCKDCVTVLPRKPQEKDWLPSTNMDDDSTQEVSAQKGGLRTMPLIIANESFQSIASIGILPNMILYLTNGYNMDVATGSTLIAIWSACSEFLAIFGAFISDSYLGRFRVIALGSIISVLGMTLLWLTAMIPQAKPAPCNMGCQNPTFAQVAFLLSSLGFISIGAGFIKPCSLAFGADQLINKNNPEKSARIVDRYFNWYYASLSLSAVIAMTVVVYIQDHFGMKVGFGVPAILMLLSASFFLVGSSFYVKEKANESLFTGLAKVPVAAYKNRHLLLPPDNSDGLYYHSEGSNFIAPSDKLRFLNKACLIKNPEEDFNNDGSAAKSRELCTVDQIEALKALISLIPIWSTGIMIYAMNPLSGISVVQATSMDRHITSNFQIPAGSFSLFTALSVAIWVAFYEQVIIPLVAKYTGRSGGISPTLRMGIGLVLACLAMEVAAVVETIRRRTAIREGFSDDPTGIVSMSAMWLIPQCCLIGLSQGINSVGQLEYYYSELPQSMSSMAMALYTLGTAFADLLASFVTTVVNNVTGSDGKISWLATNPNKAHYDYEYALICLLCLLNFVYFLFCCGARRPRRDGRARVSNEREDLKQTLLSKSKELPSTSSA